MSILFFAAFIMVAAGKIDSLPENFGIVWALFSIADALWFRRFGK